MKVTVVLTLKKIEGGTAEEDEVAEEVAANVEDAVTEVTVYDEDGEEVIYEVTDVQIKP